MQKPKEIGGISQLGQRYLDGELQQDTLPSTIVPSSSGDIGDVRSVNEEQAEGWRKQGLETLQRGEVVFGLLAAGASSRMDTQQLPASAADLLEKSGAGSKPLSKALVPVVENNDRVYTFVDLFYLNVQRFAKAVDADPKTLLFVSEKNCDEVREHLRREFADDARLLEGVHEVVQPLEPQIIARVEEVEQREANFPSPEAWRQAREFSEQYAGHSLDAPKPAGHGEFFHQLVASGAASQLLSEGVRYVTVRNIDNVPAVFDDAWLGLLGYAVENDLSILVEVSERLPEQKGGALIQQEGHWRLAEDPSFEGSGHDATESFYINNAVAIVRLDYLFPIYETTEAELVAVWKAGDTDKLAEIADRGRRRFPTIVEAKPVALDDVVVGAVTPETNMWESTAVAAGKVNIGAFGVYSEADEGRDIEKAPEDEQQVRANRVRFAPVKKWDDYENPSKQTIIRHVAERILRGPLAPAKS